MRYREIVENTDDELFSQPKPSLHRVNMQSIELGNVDTRDFPDFADAYVEYAEWLNGAALDGNELEWLTNALSDSGDLNALAHDSLYENAEDDDELFGDASLRERFHQRLQSAYNSILDKAGNLGIEAIFRCRQFAKMFEKNMSDDPIRDMAAKEPVEKLLRAIAELEKAAEDPFEYMTRHKDIRENEEDDDELFGRALHQRIADALMAAAEEDQRVSDEERGLGDLRNAAEFAEQARNYRYIASEFAKSMAQGVKVYRSLDGGWRVAVEEVVDMAMEHQDMDFRSYAKTLPESQEDDDMFGGHYNKSFAGWTAEDVKKRFNDLWDDLYYYKIHINDDPNYKQKEAELEALKTYAGLRWGEGLYNYLDQFGKHSDPRLARGLERQSGDSLDHRLWPRINKSGVMDRRDQKTLAQTIKNRAGQHPAPQLPESQEDDDLFSTSAKLDRRQKLQAKAIRRIEKRDELNIQPGTRILVKWDNGRYYKGVVDRLTRGGRLVVQVKFPNVGWPLEKNISPHEVRPEHILSESDESKYNMKSTDFIKKTHKINEMADSDDELFGVNRKTWEFQGQEKEMDRASDYIKDTARGLNLQFLGRNEYDNWVVGYEFRGREDDLRMLNNILYNNLGDGYGGVDESAINEADTELAEPPEPERRQQTDTKQKSKLDPNMFAPRPDQPLAKVDPLDDLKHKAGIGGDQPQVNIKKASQQRTLDKTAGIGSDDMASMLGRLRNIEVDKDLEAYPEPEPPETLPSIEVNTKNLPAVAGEALLAAGVQNPEFHQVANLPGNMSDQIRQLGKSLFGSLTMTPTKRIHVVANLGGQGPNTTAEVNAVAGFLKKNGQDLGPGDVDFEAVMPGYRAQTHMFSAAGIRWMLVKDFAGEYIYCWPEADSHDAVDVIGMDQDTKQLR
jgi:hypothetical protein